MPAAGSHHASRDDRRVHRSFNSIGKSFVPGGGKLFQLRETTIVAPSTGCPLYQVTEITQFAEVYCNLDWSPIPIAE
jgi:hypothetical protein